MMPDKVEILIVEDNADTAAALRSLLVFNGYVAAKVATKEEASEFFATHSNLKAVILDVSLPDGNGIGLISEIKRIYPDCKVVVTSAFAEQHWAADVSDARPDSIVMKPINFPDLRKELPNPEHPTI